MLAASIIRAMAHHPDAASTSEKSVNFYQTSWCNSPDDSHLQVIQTDPHPSDYDDVANDIPVSRLDGGRRFYFCRAQSYKVQWL
jgi:hypothetical protein